MLSFRYSEVLDDRKVIFLELAHWLSITLATSRITVMGLDSVDPNLT